MLFQLLYIEPDDSTESFGLIILCSDRYSQLYLFDAKLYNLRPGKPTQDIWTASNVLLCYSIKKHMRPHMLLGKKRKTSLDQSYYLAGVTHSLSQPFLFLFIISANLTHPQLGV